jgi:DNA polymerase I-like protein with 3'-5' exonuclease and polymerase domains
MERMAQNFRIQGTNASMTKMSMIMLYDWIKSKEWFDKVKIVLSLHDEIVIEAKDEVAEEVESKLVEFMLKSGTYFCSKVPMKVEGGIAKVWDH